MDFLALLWPTECVSCGASDRDVCARCLKMLREADIPPSFSLGMPVFARGPYAGPLRALLVAFKHDNRFGFRRELGHQLRVPLFAALSSVRAGRAPLLVTVPSRPGRVRSRGYRHMDVLVRVAIRGSALPLRRVLRTTRGRVGQVGLDAAARAHNAELIALRRCSKSVVRGREVLLVDDIITTGATVYAARRVLENAGASVIAVVALCVAERRDTRLSDRSGNGESEWSRLPERRKGAPHWPTA